MLVCSNITGWQTNKTSDNVFTTEACLTPSYEAVGCYGRGGQTSDGGDQRGHQNDRNSQSYHQQGVKPAKIRLSAD